MGTCLLGSESEFGNFSVDLEVGHMKSAYFAVAGFFLAISPGAAEQFSINDALREAAKSHPGVGEASANRRATESELRQTQSTLLPQVRVDAYYGREKFDQSASVISGSALPIPAPGTGVWRDGNQQSDLGRGTHRQ